MDVSLKPELEQYVEQQIKAGHFANVNEVLEAGVARLMLDPEPRVLDEETMDAIDEAEAQLDRGEGIPAEEAFRRLRERYLGK